MMDTGPASPKLVVERLCDAMNRHDLDGFLALIDPDYRSDQPLHPQRAFVGKDQVRKNWTKIFEEHADFHAELVSVVAEADTVWSEWHWSGTRTDGTELNSRGVIIFGIGAGQIMSGRLYMEQVQQTA